MTYTAAWVVPFSASFAVLYANNNFGHDPSSILTFFGVKAVVYETLGLSPDARLAPWQISAIYSFILADMLEIARIPFTLAVAPRVTKWLRRGSATTASPP